MTIVMEDGGTRTEKSFDEDATWGDILEGVLRMLPAFEYVFSAYPEEIAQAAMERNREDFCLRPDSFCKKKDESCGCPDCIDEEDDV